MINGLSLNEKKERPLRRFAATPSSCLPDPLRYVHGSHLCVARYPLTAAKIDKKVVATKEYRKNLRKIYVKIRQEGS